jgi:hypothetical protein
MNPSTLNANVGQSNHPSKAKKTAWYQPTLSAEHGIYVMLLVAFLTGTAAAQSWTVATTLALLCAFLAFQAEHPLVVQIRQRSSFKPRLLVWGSLYSAFSLLIALWLYWQFPVLIWLFLAAFLTFIIDAIFVFFREQKSFVNELIVFAAVCLAAPLAYTVGTGKIDTLAMGLWAINTLYFSSRIFTVKLRKTKTASPIPGIIYHTIAIGIVVALWQFGMLSLLSAAAFGIAVLKFVLIAWQQEWYRTAKIQYAAIIETTTACVFLTIIALSVLPAHLPSF